MSTQRQVLRGTSAELGSVTPVEGEVGMNTTDKRIILGDGQRVGGIPHLSFTDAQNQTFTYASHGAGSTANAIELEYQEPTLVYVEGMVVEFKASASNTGAATVKLDALTAKNIKKVSGGSKVDLEAGDLSNGIVYRFVYDGTDFVMTASSGGGGSSDQFCHGWGIIDGTGAVSLRNASNVSGVADNGAGQYTVTLSEAMDNVNYVVLTNTGATGVNNTMSQPAYLPFTTTTFRLELRTTSNVLFDMDYVFFAVFGEKS